MTRPLLYTYTFISKPIQTVYLKCKIHFSNATIIWCNPRPTFITCQASLSLHHFVFPVADSYKLLKSPVVQNLLYQCNTLCGTVSLTSFDIKVRKPAEWGEKPRGCFTIVHSALKSDQNRRLCHSCAKLTWVSSLSINFPEMRKVHCLVKSALYDVTKDISLLFVPFQTWLSLERLWTEGMMYSGKKNFLGGVMWGQSTGVRDEK